jgi:formylmethanofuran dehydrogenase subunit E
VIDPGQLDRVVAFHGHLCPGLALGVQAATIALREIGPHAGDEEVVAVVETDMCAVDAIQLLTGCTFGKGNLLHRDWGKNAFSFYRRSDGRAIRVAARPDGWRRSPEHAALFDRIRSGEAGDSEQARYQQLQEDMCRAVLELDPDAVYTVQELAGGPPRQARLHASVECASCREAVMETRIRRLGGRELCLPCFEAALDA